MKAPPNSQRPPKLSLTEANCKPAFQCLFSSPIRRNPIERYILSPEILGPTRRGRCGLPTRKVLKLQSWEGFGDFNAPLFSAGLTH